MKIEGVTSKQESFEIKVKNKSKDVVKLEFLFRFVILFIYCSLSRCFWLSRTFVLPLGERATSLHQGRYLP